MTRYVYTSEIYHHGIKGQKWGMRRYQNADSSLTEEGYRHWGLNPDGSRFNKRQRTENYRRNVKNGMVAGFGVGTAVGAMLAGPVGASVGGSAGSMAGMIAGGISGTISDARMRKKIRKLLDENGKVYVKDL